MVEPLGVAQVYRTCPTDAFDFEVTSELESLDLLVGHERARDALSFGTAIRSEGFNLFVLGQPGHDRHSLVGRFLTEKARGASPPRDWCYRYNFDDPAVPLALSLPPGLGRQLRTDLEVLVEELRSAIPAVFESEEYQNRLHEIKQAMGKRLLYYLLCEHDPEFLELFKVQADLEDELDRDPEHEAFYARMVATLAREAALRPLDRSGVAAVIERATRLADDQRKQTARHRDLLDLVLEADHWAGEEAATVIARRHVEKAASQQLWRSGRIRERSHEMITRGTMMVDTDGRVVGQVNGLSVLQLGEYAFGQPSRITATARPGNGQVVDIERETRMGGSIHSKAVMILPRYLASRYAGEESLSLSASLAFEQSYGGIEGDSASVAEVREAIEQGRFRVFAVSRVDEALELLTGLPIGAPDAQGHFPEGSLDARVAKRLTQFREVVKHSRQEERGGNGDGHKEHDDER